MEAYNAKKEQEKVAVSMQRVTETKLNPQLGAPAAADTVGEGGQQNVAGNQILEMSVIKDGLSSDEQAATPPTYPVPKTASQTLANKVQVSTSDSARPNPCNLQACNATLRIAGLSITSTPLLSGSNR